MRLVTNIALTLATLAIVPVLSAATSVSNQPFTVSISTSQPKVKVGDEIRIHVVLTNVSDKTIALRSAPSKEAAEMFYAVTVHDQNGKDAPETELGRRARLQEYGGSMGIFWLKPGETWEEDAILSELFNLSLPGEYTVQLSRHIDDDPNKQIVKSNKITFTVTQ